LPVEIEWNSYVIKETFYKKDTHTEKYTSFSNFTPLRLKTAWIKALYSRAYKICSNSKFFQNQVKRIDKVLSWNDFPKRVRHSILNHCTNNINNPKQLNKFMEDNDAKTICVQLLYAGKTGEVLVSKCVKKLDTLWYHQTFAILFQQGLRSYVTEIKRSL